MPLFVFQWSNSATLPNTRAGPHRAACIMHKNIKWSLHDLTIQKGDRERMDSFQRQNTRILLHSRAIWGTTVSHGALLVLYHDRNDACLYYDTPCKERQTKNGSTSLPPSLKLQTHAPPPVRNSTRAECQIRVQNKLAESLGDWRDSVIVIYSAGVEDLKGTFCCSGANIAAPRERDLFWDELIIEIQHSPSPFCTGKINQN